MLVFYILTGCVLFAVFALFLVIGKTMNATIHLLVKFEYILQKEYELRKENVEVRRLIKQDVTIGHDKKKVRSKPTTN
jgi:hypothetical protein